MAKRVGKFGSDKKEAYLDALRNGLRRGAAARAANVSRETPRLHCRSDPEFAQAVAQAEIDATELIEDALFKAALKGNVTACQVWLYNRASDRWQDRRGVAKQQSDPIEAVLAVNGMPAAELLAKMRE